MARRACGSLLGPPLDLRVSDELDQRGEFTVVPALWDRPRCTGRQLLAVADFVVSKSGPGRAPATA